MRNLAIILADGFEEIEAINTIDILRRAGINVEILSLNDKIVTGAHGITLNADDVFDYYGFNGFDGIVFAGGMPNAISLSENSQVTQLINSFYDNGKLVCGICATPAIVFSKTKLLDDNLFTCYPGMSKSSNYVDKPVVVSKNVITSQSPYTAMSFALTIVKELGYDISGLQKDLKGEK